MFQLRIYVKIYFFLLLFDSPFLWLHTENLENSCFRINMLFIQLIENKLKLLSHFSKLVYSPTIIRNKQILEHLKDFHQISISHAPQSIYSMTNYRDLSYNTCNYYLILNTAIISRTNVIVSFNYDYKCIRFNAKLL